MKRKKIIAKSLTVLACLLLALTSANAQTNCIMPTIIWHPSDVVYCQGDWAEELFVKATGSGLSYQWYSKTDTAAADSVKITGATAA